MRAWQATHINTVFVVAFVLWMCIKCPQIFQLAVTWDASHVRCMATFQVPLTEPYIIEKAVPIIHSGALTRPA